MTTSHSPKKPRRGSPGAATALAQRSAAGHMRLARKVLAGMALVAGVGVGGALILRHPSAPRRRAAEPNSTTPTSAPRPPVSPHAARLYHVPQLGEPAAGRSRPSHPQGAGPKSSGCAVDPARNTDRAGAGNGARQQAVRHDAVRVREISSGPPASAEALRRRPQQARQDHPIQPPRRTCRIKAGLPHRSDRAPHGQR